MTQHKMAWIRVQKEGLGMACFEDSCQTDTTKTCIWGGGWGDDLSSTFIWLPCPTEVRRWRREGKRGKNA